MDMELRGMITTLVITVVSFTAAMIGLVALSVAASGILVMLCWNYLVNTWPLMAELPNLAFWQAIAISWLCHSFIKPVNLDKLIEHWTKKAQAE